MRFTAVVATVVICGGLALAQKPKDPVPRTPSMSNSGRSTVAPTPLSKSSAAELSKIEQHTRVASNKTAEHRASGSAAATPALNLGKNKPIRASRSPQPTNPNGH